MKTKFKYSNCLKALNILLHIVVWEARLLTVIALLYAALSAADFTVFKHPEAALSEFRIALELQLISFLLLWGQKALRSYFKRKALP